MLVTNTFKYVEVPQGEKGFRKENNVIRCRNY
jgi:hypothetical protein